MSNWQQKASGRNVMEVSFIEALLPECFVRDRAANAPERVLLKNLARFLRKGDAEPDPDFVKAMHDLYTHLYIQVKAGHD